jgi:hypothetical protein
VAKATDFKSIAMKTHNVNKLGLPLMKLEDILDASDQLSGQGRWQKAVVMDIIPATALPSKYTDPAKWGAPKSIVAILDDNNIPYSGLVSILTKKYDDPNDMLHNIAISGRSDITDNLKNMAAANAGKAQSVTPSLVWDGSQLLNVPTRTIGTETVNAFVVNTTNGAGSYFLIRETTADAYSVDGQYATWGVNYILAQLSY